MGRFHEFLRRITPGHPRLVAHDDAEKPRLAEALQRRARALNRLHQVRRLDGSYLFIDGAVPVEEDRRPAPDIASAGGGCPVEKIRRSGDHLLDPDRPHASMINRAVAVAARTAERRSV